MSPNPRKWREKLTADSSNNDQSSRPPARRRERVLTRTGRANSAQNATRHGALSTRVVGSREEQAAFDDLLDELVREYDPGTATEYSLVHRLAVLFWREKRLAASEAQTLRQTENEINPLGGQTPMDIGYQLLVGRYQTMLGNQVNKTIAQLKSLKTDD
tara:strand:- start:1644 stop:2120 length:477 start_codon:yes stop_codon:yes gene_type:complete